ncbi:MAG TPA: hypothetical protein RMH99_24690 [Sandaracinaceae bacterium LLY-WYZ-13_1]|nr:hypothetical protein [Sandaracinaceae bacterium LLY-WYZ-13_1]
MDRALIETILAGTSGLEKSDTGFQAADEHRASIYLGGSASTTVLSDLVRIQLHETHLEAEAKDRTLHFVTYDPILGLQVRRPREDGPRTGF